jgi:hypothetical protein
LLLALQTAAQRAKFDPVRRPRSDFVRAHPQAHRRARDRSTASSCVRRGLRRSHRVGEVVVVKRGVTHVENDVSDRVDFDLVVGARHFEMPAAARSGSFEGEIALLPEVFVDVRGEKPGVILAAAGDDSLRGGELVDET